MGVADKIGESTFQKVWLISLALVGAYYFLLFDDGSSLDAAVQAAKGQLNEQQTMLVETRRALADAQRFEEEVKRITSQFNEVIEFLPTNLTVAELMRTLTTEAATAGAQVVKIEPKSKGERKEFYETMAIDLELEGSYSQVVLFLSLLSKVPRLLTFEKVSLAKASSDGDSAKVRFAGTLMAYRYVAEAKKDETNADAAPKQDANAGQ